MLPRSPTGMIYSIPYSEYWSRKAGSSILMSKQLPFSWNWFNVAIVNPWHFISIFHCSACAVSAPRSWGTKPLGAPSAGSLLSVSSRSKWTTNLKISNRCPNRHRSQHWLRSRKRCSRDQSQFWNIIWLSFADLQAFPEGLFSHLSNGECNWYFTFSVCKVLAWLCRPLLYLPIWRWETKMPRRVCTIYTPCMRVPWLP